MSLLRDKNILIGVSASIAAYKSAHLVREFVKLGANVRVVMTPESKGFITPLTLSTLSKNPVLSTLVKEENEEEWNNHVKIGLWADLMIIAPATAKTISKMANGECDNLLLTTYLSARCPVFFAPAMDLDMLSHPSTQDNIQKLISFGNHYIPVSDGELASGLVGKGRMAEPLEIVNFVQKEIVKSLPLKGKKILITAGPTFEAIDPVRFIGNHSSGKMGYSIALTAANLGAEVTLISGPTHQQIIHPNVLEIKITSSAEMLVECNAYFPETDAAILSAAVADYTPSEVHSSKLKKSDNDLTLRLKKTTDILKTLGQKKTNQILVGFALETDNEIENAKVKLTSKNLDFIVLNSLNDNGAGFKHDTNKITIIDNDNKLYKFELKSKDEVAEDIINHLIKKI
ncbi:bifunctional phosphopantothenoylcysteine decarboxylase/phosphopantothenate--cysteine ligase CoaBC [Flavobacteriales bacterium]|nr:bifunctional phosphopantothenoylcysteine decarboxylase/phosphopantothenate--cysteine ligase CoaBC [Flavobacteriales bacterium]